MLVSVPLLSWQQGLVPLFEFEKWQSHLYCQASVSEPTSPLQRPPPSLSLLSLKSSSVQSASAPPPPRPSALPLCGWCIIMSVGEGMAVCVPQRVFPHTVSRKRTHRPEQHPALLFSSTLFTPHNHCSARALRDSIVSLTHSPTTQRGMVITKTWGGGQRV